MTAALIILGALTGVGLALYLHYRLTGGDQSEPRKTGSAPENAAPEASECCGMHITCEKDSLLAAVSQEIEYYDDEELDAYRGRGAHDYTDDEIEQFRDVLLTLLPADIAGWARSMQSRGITLPECVREELLMIVAEERGKRHA